MKNTINRRKFLKNSLLASGGILLVPNFISCDIDDQVDTSDIPKDLDPENFNEGVASFDPTSNQVIIWTRYTTAKNMENIVWQLASDSNFNTIVRSGKVITDSLRDHTIAVEIQNLEAGKKFFYRFINIENKNVSVTGETITLPNTNSSEIAFAVASCSNYAAGLFNVYDAIAKSDADVVIHLGDYIYEYGKGEYGTNSSTDSLGRHPKPENEIITLDDYRTRYKQYRSDSSLLLAHQKKPFICIWDDHEIANDAYNGGAENHDASEGDFELRKQAALQAYSEYLPCKTNDINIIYRNFEIGSLANIILLDTRLIGRNKQLDYKNYFNTNGDFDAVKFQQDWLDTSRTLLGETQRNWLLGQVAGSNAQWQIIAQQVLMGNMLIPAELLGLLATILTEVSTTGEISPQTMLAFQTKLNELVTIKVRYQQNDPTLTPDEIKRITTVLPYNLDAWDGYPFERGEVLKSFTGKNVIVLAGDTHNAWHNNLKIKDTIVAQEFATSSVTSPGFEGILGSNPSVLNGFQEAIKILIDDLKYLDVSQRGYMKVSINQSGATSQWVYIDSILTNTYNTTVGHMATV